MKQILYFTASWCGPCKLLKPKIQAMQSKFPITILDVDTNAEACSKYSVRNVPTIIVTNNGNEIARLVGNTITEQRIIESFNR
jgi:thiol-disulfide isomerase/thioredoxin